MQECLLTRCPHCCHYSRDSCNVFFTPLPPQSFHNVPSITLSLLPLLLFFTAKRNRMSWQVNQNIYYSFFPCGDFISPPLSQSTQCCSTLDLTVCFLLLVTLRNGCNMCADYTIAALEIQPPHLSENKLDEAC